MSNRCEIIEAFQIRFVRLNLVFLTQFQKLRESYESVYFLVLQTKFTMKACGLSFLLSVCRFGIIGDFVMFSPPRFDITPHVCSKIHTPSHAGCGFLLFSLNSCFTLFVIHVILIWYELLVSSLNLLKVFHFWNNTESQLKLMVYAYQKNLEV